MGNNDTKKEWKVVSIDDIEEIEKEYKIDTDKITSLEDVKEILGALNLGIKGTSKIMYTNGHNMNKLSKYLK